MARWTITALRTVLVLAMLGSLFVQVFMVPLMADDLVGAPDWFRTALLTIIILAVVAVQVTMVCIWQLLTMVRRSTVFSEAAFRYVDVIIGAIAAASLLTFGLGGVLAPTSVAPGVVLLVGGAALLAAGMALLIVVMRALLAQAVDRDAEARQLKAELDEVI
ncbi:MAG: DUF2975 domain-containing protein [Brooklawnia sp.]|uniref:DUF2975 domain-containing protein n=1 Tax=Brooklawnia sp. TaxID=2699740 RepID=UPI003C785F5F